MVWKLKLKLKLKLEAQMSEGFSLTTEDGSVGAWMHWHLCSGYAASCLP